jgi:NADPH:quinone reductase
VIRVTRSTIIDAPITQVWAVLREFNSHIDWHPAIAKSVIENREPEDQVGCIRAFTLQDGNQLREQLIALSDEDCVSTYCILDSTIPLKRYVASVRLKPVTDGQRTFWHWQSTFDTPPGQEAALSDAVGNGVYETGFQALREYLKTPASQKYTGSKEATQNKFRLTKPSLQNAAPASVYVPISPPLSLKSGMASNGNQEQQAHSIIIRQHGGAEVLQLDKVSVRPPGSGEVRIQQHAIGVNYIDVYVRKGIYPMLTPPGTPGMEAAGQIFDVGPGVTHLMPGDRVAYACPPVGAYAGLRNMAAASLVRIPDWLDYERAAALMLKGMTAEVLLHRVHQVKAGDSILVHAAAGGVGLFLCQWAKSLGAKVYGTVSNQPKAEEAREAGCDFPIIRKLGGGFADEVLRLTQDRGVDVIYDGLGGPAFMESFKSLAMCGHIVSYGQAGGAMEALDTGLLSSKSATLSRPVLFHYTANSGQLNIIASNVFHQVQAGRLNIAVNHRYALGEASQAHLDLEASKTTGAIVLLP